MALITNIKHYLGPGLSMVRIPAHETIVREFLGCVVNAVTSRNPDGVNCVTQLKCREGSGGCDGDIIAGYDQEDPSVIKWSCSSCGEYGLLSGWENTVWDNRWE